MFAQKKFIQFIIIFFAVFSICYFGTLLVIGLSVPGGSYSPFVAKYLNYVDLLRNSLLAATKFILSFFNIPTYRLGDYTLRGSNGRGIKMIYACIGYGVMSFWIAYTLATRAVLKKKIIWLFAGLLLLWVINVCRLALVLVSTQHNWSFPFGWDHHTWFNIIAYTFIFLMMYFFEKNIKANHPRDK